MCSCGWYEWQDRPFRRQFQRVVGVHRCPEFDVQPGFAEIPALSATIERRMVRVDEPIQQDIFPRMQTGLTNGKRQTIEAAGVSWVFLFDEISVCHGVRRRAMVSMAK